MKRLIRSKSFLTVISVLSVLLFFSVLCVGSLMLLSRLDIVRFPFEEEAVVIANSENDGSETLSLRTDTEANISDLGEDIHAADRLIGNMPFVDSYYMKLQVESESETGQFASGLYEIWRYGDKYRISRYRAGGEVVRIVISDASRVQMTDFDAVTVEYAAYSTQYDFKHVAPFPDFSDNFSHNTHSLMDHRRIGNRRIFTYEYPLSGEVEEIDLYSDTGILQSYRRYLGDRTLLEINVITVDMDFSFSDYMFEFD